MNFPVVVIIKPLSEYISESYAKDKPYKQAIMVTILHGENDRKNNVWKLFLGWENRSLMINPLKQLFNVIAFSIPWKILNEAVWFHGKSFSKA